MKDFARWSANAAGHGDVIATDVEQLVEPLFLPAGLHKLHYRGYVIGISWKMIQIISSSKMFNTVYFVLSSEVWFNMLGILLSLFSTPMDDGEEEETQRHLIRNNRQSCEQGVITISDTIR